MQHQHRERGERGSGGVGKQTQESMKMLKAALNLELADDEESRANLVPEVDAGAAAAETSTLVM
jgi:hypothetical protein